MVLYSHSIVSDTQDTMQIIPIKIERKIARIQQIWIGIRNSSKQVYVHQRIDEYRSMWKAAADAMEADFKILANDIWEIEKNKKKTRINNDLMEFDNPVTLQMAGRKPLLYRLLEEGGLNVPPYQEFFWNQLDIPNSFLERFPKGCVVKPANGTSSGQGVSTHLQTPKEVHKASVLASLYCKDLLIEPMIPGECYRLLVLNGEVVHATCRRGLRMVGDGKSTVSELIQSENRRRKENPMLDVAIDRDLIFTLSYQDLSMQAVLPDGKMFLVKSVNDPQRNFIEVRTVYNETVTDIVCDSLKEDAIQAAKILGSTFAGVDFITVDASVPLAISGGSINEVNTTPGMHHHYDKDAEAYPKVAVKVLKYLLK